MSTANSVSIRLEFTPNPNTLKFVVDQAILDKGAAQFGSLSDAAVSPLALAVLKVVGMQSVLLGTNFITVTKAPDGNWDTIATDVPKSIEAHFNSGTPHFDSAWLAQRNEKTANPTQTAAEKKIQEILDNEIRPAVAMDGGDITFDRYENGVVYLHLQGACSSCPSSIMTLKMGVETRLKEEIPEIIEVVQV